MSDRVTKRQKQEVVQRARGCCEYCRSQARYATDSFSIEHIVPRARGGATTLDNLALSCQGCNNFKHTKTEGLDPLTKTKAPLFHARQQEWRDHFAWNEDFTQTIGLTPTGRATVATLKLNRAELLNLRHVLHLTGRHPLEE